VFACALGVDDGVGNVAVMFGSSVRINCGPNATLTTTIGPHDEPLIIYRNGKILESFGGRWKLIEPGILVISNAQMSDARLLTCTEHYPLTKRTVSEVLVYGKQVIS